MRMLNVKVPSQEPHDIERLSTVVRRQSGLAPVLAVGDSVSAVVGTVLGCGVGTSLGRRVGKLLGTGVGEPLGRGVAIGLGALGA